VARDFYNNDLATRPELSLALGREVQFTSAGRKKSFSLSGNPDKLKLFAALRDMIRHGHKVGELSPDGHKEELNTKAYHYLEADVLLEGRPLTVEVIIREDNNGSLYYDNRPIAGMNPGRGHYTGKPRRQSRPESKSGGTPGFEVGKTYDQIVPYSDDGGNITIVAQPDGNV